MKGEALITNRVVRLIPYKVKSIQEAVDTVPAGVEIIEAPQIWAEANEGDGIVVAILDTGIDYNHPDLKDAVIEVKNFTDEGAEDDVMDGNGHGTHVAGTIAARREGYGLVGVAPKAKLLILKVLDSQGSGSYESIIQAMNYAADWRGPNGEKVRAVNMSLGGPEDVPELHEAVKRLVDSEIPVIVAAGNEGDDRENTFEYSYPGSYNEVIEVAASTLTNEVAPFSNSNNEIDVLAPGVDIVSTWVDGQYAKLSGTSMATPHVVGAVALLITIGERSFKRTLTEAEIYALLVKRTVSLGNEATAEGHGLIKLNYSEKVRRLVSYIGEVFV
ncbi:S8 family peptidase [Robertmurraya kyonggiensis]|uniref:Serine protease n=1 Tax=Robertmurraya kyonggiensis TaxID=1037680 RepID=A0A4U1D4X0_9BACI|nr:S8 family peptidase [Robertmurraya kyonggiensis]TKC16793.1 serine protease [Robertmurraya kyonggiensis]